jgi:hypothetical protein
MGGTGLEPVTPSLSITLVCTLSRRLVVARGSTVQTSETYERH